MPLFEKHLDFFNLFLSTNSKQRKALLASSTKDQRLAIAEIVFNFLQGSIPDIDQAKTDLFPYRFILRGLSKKVVTGKTQYFAKHSRILYILLSKIFTKLK